MKNKFNDYLKASSLLLLSNTVTGAVVYTDVDPDLIANGVNDNSTDYYNVDINNDGTDDFRIAIHNIDSIKSSYPNNGVLDYTFNAVWVEGLDSNYMNGLDFAYSTNWNSGVNFLKTPFYGKLIDSSESFKSWGYLGLKDIWTFNSDSFNGTGGRGDKGLFSGNGDKFIGLKFTPDGENMHYGWIRINVSADNSSFTLLDYAYNDVPFAPISAGQMPAGVGRWHYSIDSYYGKQFGVNSPITSTDVFLMPKYISTATYYEIEINKDSTFETPGLVKSGSGPSPKQSDFYFSGLPQNTKYYVRGKINNEYWGDKIKTFTTHQIGNSVWTSDGEYGINASLHRTSLFVVPYEVSIANSGYIVEVNTSNTFTGTSYTRSGTGPNVVQADYWFSNLQYNKTYYVRVSIDGGTTWGKTSNFRTHNVGETVVNYYSDGAFGVQFASLYPTTSTSLFIVPKYYENATSYTVEISKFSDFSTVFATKTGTGPNITQNQYWFGGLEYSTQYYARVKTNNDPYGKKTYFFTQADPNARNLARNTNPIENQTSAIFTSNAYPNPFENQITLNIQSKTHNEITVRVFDIFGREAETGKQYSTNQNINLGENLKKGTYIIQIENGEENEYLKIIKE